MTLKGKKTKCFNFTQFKCQPSFADCLADLDHKLFELVSNYFIQLLNWSEQRVFGCLAFLISVFKMFLSCLQNSRCFRSRFIYLVYKLVDKRIWALIYNVQISIEIIALYYFCSVEPWLAEHLLRIRQNSRCLRLTQLLWTWLLVLSR